MSIFKKIKKGDLFILVLVLLIMAGWILYWFFIKNSGNDRLIAVISVKGEVIRTITLNNMKDQHEIVEISKNPEITAEIDNNKIRFINATCPDKLCEKTGWLFKEGHIAVCIPFQSFIKIEGQKSNSEIDGTTW